eukprot:54752-Amphidinium_carterae.1
MKTGDGSADQKHHIASVSDMVHCHRDEHKGRSNEANPAAFVPWLEYLDWQVAHQGRTSVCVHSAFKGRSSGPNVTQVSN